MKKSIYPTSFGISPYTRYTYIKVVRTQDIINKVTVSTEGSPPEWASVGECKVFEAAKVKGAL